ncbi:MAG: hypothetical protein JWM88_2611 [Verrucomicrobia bacterium]|nr:hypothetical protein [Verrucomicrobiota bacterium]
MKPFFSLGVLLISALAMAAADAPPPEKKKTDSPPAAPAANAGQSALASTPAVNGSAQETPPPPSGNTDVATAAPVPHPAQNATVLPRVEVNKSRITNLDIEINEQQRAIDREKLKTKPTRLDDTLNNDKVAKSLSIFGGSSSEGRAGLAKERVQILSEEKEILEAMKTAQTREEKDELKKELELLRQMRRELEQGQK